MTDTFEPTGLGRTIFEERYARNGETWQEAAQRVAHAVSRAEVNGKADYFEKLYFAELNEGRFMPGGRIMRNAGLGTQQMLNCFVVPTEDSIEGWAKTTGDTMVISSKGGGVGINFSPIRPRGYEVKGIGGISTGSVSLMGGINDFGSRLVGGGGRRMALMFDLLINHPDIMEFIDEKLDRGQLNNANVSVVIPPDMPTEEFVRLVREDGEIPLMFNGLPDKQGRTISAKKLWERIVTNAWNSGEPGVLNGYEANRMSNMYYHYPLISTNPCGEIWLPAYGSCDLGALVLPRFVVDGKLDWDALEESVRLGVRFLDDVLDVNAYPLPEIEKVSQGERRIGLGVMGLHSMLLDLGMKYNSEEAYAFIDKMFAFIKNTAYDASIMLAAEKGPFQWYQPQFADSGFMKTVKRAIRNKVRHYGIRNSAILTIAPTGTTSMVHGVTGGIEPLFSPVYVRRRKVAEADGTTTVAKTLVVSQEYVDHPDIAQGAYDITPEDHLRMQATVQKHIDNAVSKTINLPEDYPVDELGELWLKYLHMMKGSTIYRQGSRGEEPMEHVPASEMDKIVAEWNSKGLDVEYEAAESMECANGACAIDLPGGVSDVSMEIVIETP